MVAAELLEILTKYPSFAPLGIEDYSDRFNFFYCVIVLSLSSCLVTVKQYLFKALSCYIATPLSSGSNLNEYVEYYCWVEGTVPAPFNTIFPNTEEEWRNLETDKIAYYPWIPLVLGVQSMLFYLPKLLWTRLCCNHMGCDVHHLMKFAKKAQTSDTQTRRQMIATLCRAVQKKSPNCKSKLVFYYFFLKHIQLANCALQIIFIVYFLDFERVRSQPNSKEFPLVYLLWTSVTFGFTLLCLLLTGQDWQKTMIFPRMAFCRVPVQIMGSWAPLTAQCTLPINILNEMIYTFLWFWLMCTFLLTFSSLLVWTWRLVLRGGHCRAKLISLLFRAMEEQHTFACRQMNTDKLNQFRQTFLSRDGTFLLFMLKINTCDAFVAEIMLTIWNQHLSTESQNSLNSASQNSETESAACLWPEAL